MTKFNEIMKKFRVEKWLLRIILISLIIFICSKINFIFTPLVIVFQTVTIPIVLSGVLFYLLSPLRNFMVKKLKINKLISIIIIYIMLIIAFTVFYLIVFPILKSQVAELTAQLPNIINDLKWQLYIWEESGKIGLITSYITIDELFIKIHDFAQSFIIEGSKDILTYVGKVSTFIIYLIVVPIMLFYMLKDGDKLGESILRFVAEPLKKETRKIMFEMNDQLHSYVIGQITVYLVVGILNLIGFYVLGVKYALLLALLFVIINCVPVIGVFFAAIPAVVVALLDSPMLALKVIILVTIVNQLDTHVLSPQIMGKKLNIHPLTIIVLMLVAGEFLGVLGLVFALPVYAVSKVLVINLHRVYLVYKNKTNITEIVDTENIKTEDDEIETTETQNIKTEDDKIEVTETENIETENIETENDETENVELEEIDIEKETTEKETTEIESIDNEINNELNENEK